MSVSSLFPLHFDRGMRMKADEDSLRILDLPESAIFYASFHHTCFGLSLDLKLSWGVYGPWEREILHVSPLCLLLGWE